MRYAGLTWTCTAALGAATTAFMLTGTAGATIPYGGLAPGVPGPVGPGLAPPSIVPGKEYSHDLDHMITAVGTAPDPKQVVAWDGSGGVTDGLDFSPPVFPTALVGLDVDAIANHGDHLFDELLGDDAHLLYSLDKDFVGYGPGGVMFMGTVPSGAPAPGAPPVILGNGAMVGGSGEISYELGVVGGLNGTDIHGRWADQAEINGMPFPDDIDGLEIWGPEPAVAADTDKLSLRVDAATMLAGPATSVHNADGSTYVGLPAITAAVTSLLGPIPTTADVDALNLDALMVSDVFGEDTDFGRDPAGGLGIDAIIFSIDQVPDAADPDGYYATGSEIFVLDAAGGAFFLPHGGHAWDHAYALSTFTVGTPGNQNYFALDIDAIEAVGEEVVPEPAAAALLLSGLALITRRRAA